MAGYYRLDNLDELIQLLIQRDIEVIGPKVEQDALMYRPVSKADELPWGYTDEQEGGHYRLLQSGDDTCFSCVVGPDSWKRYLFVNEDVLLTSRVEEGNLIFRSSPPQPVQRAFLGVRACELDSLAIQDRVFLDSGFSDERYASRRANIILIAVNCSRSADTCFCASLDVGPKAKSGFDLSLTEIKGEKRPWYLLEVGTEIGEELVEALQLVAAAEEEVSAATIVVQEAAAQQTRKMSVEGLKESIYQNLDNDAFWEDVGSRCLSCTNCTMVCPTCFCFTVEDKTNLSGSESERVQYWDSCFSTSHSHIAGGSVRESSQSRYRQWFSHKLASWQDQFDTLGCSGCGRCITWCPVGIDITAEAARIQALELTK